MGDTGDSVRDEWTPLMVRAQSGDHAAYNALLKALVPLIRAVVRRKISDDALIEDVVQDALLTIHRVRDTYDPARPIGPWVHAIAVSRSIDALRRRGRRMAREVQDDDAMTSHADIAAVARIDAVGQAGEIDGLLRRLPDRQRRMVELVHLREMSLSDAAVSSRLSVPAVKALLHRAFTTLRQSNGAKDNG